MFYEIELNKILSSDGQAFIFIDLPIFFQTDLKLLNQQDCNNFLISQLTSFFEKRCGYSDLKGITSFKELKDIIQQLNCSPDQSLHDFKNLDELERTSQKEFS